MTARDRLRNPDPEPPINPPWYYDNSDADDDSGDDSDHDACRAEIERLRRNERAMTDITHEVVEAVQQITAVAEQFQYPPPEHRADLR